MTDLQDISCPHCRKKISAAGAQFCPYCGKDLNPKKRKPRRPNGAGSVTHCGDRRKKPWRARVSAGTRSYTVGYFATSAEAQKAIALFVPPDDPSSRDTITLGEVYDIVMHEKELTVTDATLHTYKYAWQPLSPLSGRKIADLRPADYQIVIDHMTDASRSACDKVRSLLSQLCGWAIANGIMSSNLGHYCCGFFGLSVYLYNPNA